MSDCIIETRGLTKRYGDQVSVSNLDLHVRKGRIYSLLGRNGAGKTTTMKMLLGLTAPTSGTVSLFGQPLKGNEKSILPRIGSLIESPGFYPNLTGMVCCRHWDYFLWTLFFFRMHCKIVKIPLQDKNSRNLIHKLFAEMCIRDRIKLR